MKLIVNQPGLVDASENVLNMSKNPTRFGVLELSTRACKLLVADLRMLQEGFRWNAFQNKSQLSSTGLLLTDDKRIPWTDFEEHVIPIIKKHIITARSLRVERLFCIATAALRQATNREEIVCKIQKSLGLRIQLLDQTQEAKATIDGYIWKEQSKITTKTQEFILVDQGGGSTEITSFSCNKNTINFHKTANVTVGTATTIQSLLHVSETTPIRQTLGNVLHTQCNLIGEEVSSMALPPQCTIIGVGSAITRATHKLGNRRQHGSVLSTESLAKQKGDVEEILVSKYNNIHTIRNMLLAANHSQADKLQELLTSYFGLGMYIGILRTLGAQHVTVNGAGLRYGICYQKINIRYPKLQQGELRKNMPNNHMQIDGLREHSYVEGTVSNIDPRFGIFVRLHAKHTGLVHIKQLQKKNTNVQNFRKGDVIDVYISKIKKNNKQFHFYLEFCSIVRTNR